MTISSTRKHAGPGQRLTCRAHLRPSMPIGSCTWVAWARSLACESAALRLAPRFNAEIDRYIYSR
jgi:hypothetical protein